jgi:hypothetical protein
MSADWTLSLTRTLTLKSGRQLRTLGDAADLILDRFGNVTKSALVEHASELLMRAAETQADEDLAAATDQVDVMLRVNWLA